MSYINTYTSSHPCEIQGTITFHKSPHLGPNTDVEGNGWDVRSIRGDTVNAVPKEQLHNYYSDTSGDHSSYFDVGTSGPGTVTQTWKPYKYKVEKDT